MLGEKQSEFIELIKSGQPYILVEAPAGTGKTFCCIQAAKALCDAGMLYPFQKVLILTFSRNARAQLLKELSKVPRESSVHKQIEINNYHSFFKKYLDVYRDILGIQKPLTIIDDEDFMMLLSLYAKEHNIILAKGVNVEIIDDYCLENNTLTLINSRSKYKRISTNEKGKFLNCATMFTRDTGYICFAQFGNMACQILKSSAQMAEAISHDYPALVLDEYQDTNYYQEQFISQVLKNSKGIFFADKWQMIYAFRGSTEERLDILPAKYPSIKQITFYEYYRYKDKPDLINILISIRNGQTPDYSILKSGKLINCSAPCENNWQIIKGKVHKAQCTLFSKSIFFSSVNEITGQLKQNKSVAVLCRHNEVANKLAEVFFENNLHPRSVSDTPEMIRIGKYLKRCLEPIPLNQKMGSLLVVVALCTMTKKIDGEDFKSLYCLDVKALSRKRKPLLKAIYLILEPHLNETCTDVSLQVIAQILTFLSTHDSITLNFARKRYVEHCIYTKDLTPILVDHIMMQRQYIDSFTNISPGLYITTIHQSKGKEFDCVFVVDIDDIAKEENLMYVANSRMKESLYPIRIKYTGLPY